MGKMSSVMSVGVPMDVLDVQGLERFSGADRWAMLVCFVLVALYCWYLETRAE